MTRRSSTARTHRGSAAFDVTLIIEQLRRPVPGGIGTYTRQLLRGLSVGKQEASMTIGLYASRGPRGDDPLRDLPFELRTSLFPGPMMTRLWDRGRAGIHGSGVVHALSMSAPSTPSPLVVTVHDLAFRELPDTFTPYGREWHEAAFLRVAEEADYFVVPSEQVRAALLESGAGISEERVRVIAEGADHLPEPDDDATSALLDKFGVEGKFILSVGTLEPRKNLTRLIEAFVQCRNEFDDSTKLVVCGPVGWSVNLSAPDGVVFTGLVDESILAGLYARAHLVAYVPLLEGFGLPVVEAMHEGAVVVASAVPSAREGALIVDPYDVSSIAGGLLSGMNDDTLRAELRVVGQRYSATLTWEQTANEHRSLWNEMMDR